MTKFAGIVLCGGESKRMGTPKAWQPIGGELMLQRVVRLMREAVEPVYVVAAPTQELPPLPTEVRIVRDAREGRGPLQGLAAGLSALTGTADTAFVSSCDVPFLRPAFVRRMFELLGSHSICVPHVDSHFHALAAAYRVQLLDSVQKLLDADRLKIQTLFDIVPTRLVVADELRDVDPTLESLRNVNTHADYEQAVRELA